VVVLFNAQLLRIDLDDNHRAAAIEIGDFTGQRRTLPINGPLILAMGGIESVRTLLLNDHQHKAGLGGAGGWLGRAFMEHPCLEAGWIDTDDPFRLQSAFGTRLYRGSRYGSRVEATSRWQADHRMLGATAGVMWLYEDGDVGPLSRLRGLARRPGPAGVARAFKDLGRLAPSFWALATQGLAYKPGARASLVVSAEQAPDRESRIGLSDRLDPFGRRQALLDWRIGPQTWTTIVAFVETLRSELSRLGLGQVRLHEHLRADEPDWETHLSDVNHHMGGARMSRTAGEGVVDADLAVWGTRNLHVCSAAVFPTGGHSNPTLTALALGERLAARLAGS
jgi:choline dehydrogenase-like flavoprotein